MLRQPDTEFFALPKPRAIAHRGASGTHPENTMASFRAAAETGARYIELDVHMTRDGEVVVSHDSELARMCDRPGTISALTYKEVVDADAGYGFVAPDGSRPFAGKGIGIPKLSEVLSELRDIRYVIEIKQTEPSLVLALLEILNRTGMRRRVIIASEHQQPLNEVRAAAPPIPTSFSAEEIGAFVQALPREMAGYEPPADALQIPPEYYSFKLVTPQSVAAAKRLGLEIHVWTVNEEPQMRELLAAGVDGIITDFPVRLLKLM